MNISNDINAGSHSQGVNIQTGPNGEVYCAWAVYDNWGLNVFGEDAIGFNVSTDGGATWGTPQRVYSAVNFGVRTNPNVGWLPKSGIRLASFPSMAVDRSGGPNDGNIYITWPQINVAPAGSDPDIVMIRSTDGGTNWSSPLRVNDDPLNNGKDQYYPWMTVDQSNGQLVFVFYDSRETTNDSSGVWGALSVDGGNSFENFRISDENFRPKPIGGLAGGYQGDYIGIAALDDIAYPYWADDRTGNYQGWMSVVSFGPPCPIDPPSNPNPVSGAADVDINLAQLTWDNGAGATAMEFWFGEAGNMTLVHDGSLITSWNVPGPLEYSTVYNWRVKGRNDTCTISGPVWAFTTMSDPNIIIDELFFDDFESGDGNWAITNTGGCPWQIVPITNNGYTLPSTASGNVMVADADDCGSSGGGSSGDITLVTPLDASLYETVWIEFDNDWQAIDSDDFAMVDVSVDGGSSWQNVLTFDVTDIRNTHEIIDISSIAGNSSSLLVRLVSIQPGWDWWWAVDNFAVMGQSIVPVELTSFAAVAAGNNVHLNWTTATETNNQGFEIQRSSVDGEYEKVSFVPGFGTTTETKSYSYTDSKIISGSYTYRLKQIDFDGTYDYSEVVIVEVTTPIEYALEQNYPNPFNPATIISYSIPQDGLVTLEVFNLLGEKVASLVNEVKEAGKYEVNFDASNLASGIYVYNLKANSFNAVKKMLLMK
ncbi:T9SS type A sorting domain-containing protein [Bacteroidota bacterium]